MSKPASRKAVQTISGWGFIRAFVNAPQRVGAVAPTSAGVARRMASLGGVSSARVVAEFGAGTGAITKHLLDALPDDGRLWSYEIHPPFVEELAATFDDQRLTVLDESAEGIEALQEREGLPTFDAVISSLPFSLMGVDMTRNVLSAVSRVLSPDGAFVALQYHPSFLPPLLRDQFDHFEHQRYLWNIPPANLLRATKARRD